jgi:succinate dehydrogenase / fumarate reductase cytochrome b subunit
MTDQTPVHVKRPLSPHLQVYRPQLTTILSIVHRATGIALSVGTILMTWWLISLAMGPDTFASAQQFLRSTLGLILLAGWTWSLFYHLANGIRHLAWDAGLGFSLESTYVSGWIVVVASFVLTGLAWAAGYWKVF